jgi:hypothetical protein
VTLTRLTMTRLTIAFGVGRMYGAERASEPLRDRQIGMSWFRDSLNKWGAIRIERTRCPARPMVNGHSAKFPLTEGKPVFIVACLVLPGQFQ